MLEIKRETVFEVKNVKVLGPFLSEKTRCGPE